MHTTYVPFVMVSYQTDKTLPNCSQRQRTESRSHPPCGKDGPGLAFYGRTFSGHGSSTPSSFQDSLSISSTRRGRCASAQQLQLHSSRAASRHGLENRSTRLPFGGLKCNIRRDGAVRRGLERDEGLSQSWSKCRLSVLRSRSAFNTIYANLRKRENGRAGVE